MNSCEVDDTTAAIFANWTLPFLETLNLQNNHLSDEGIIGWVTKLNMPSLAHLNLSTAPATQTRTQLVTRRSSTSPPKTSSSSHCG